MKAKGLVRDNSQLSIKGKANGAQDEDQGLDDNSSDPIINVSSAYLDQKKDFDPLPVGVNSLHEGIQFLQENLKQLEGKYNDLTSFYKQKDRQVASPVGKFKPELLPKSQLDRELRQAVDRRSVEKDSDMLLLLQSFKLRLNLSRDQTQVFDQMKSEIVKLHTMTNPPTKNAYDMVLDVESSFAEYKEATFQIKLISDQVGIDLKRTIRSLNQLSQREKEPVAEVAQYLGKSLDKLSSQKEFFDQLDKSLFDLSLSLGQLKSRPNDQQNTKGDSTREIQQLKDQLTQRSANETAQSLSLKRAEAQLAELRAQNQDLRTKIDIQNIDLRQKQLLLTQRESQKQETSQQLSQQAQTTREVKNLQSSEERLRHTLETLIHLTNRFLTAMRKLQKVVHKREPNVNQEKQDFETAKRDLELTLKSIISSIFPKDSSRQSVSDTSDIPHKHDKQLRVRAKTDATPPLNLKIQVSQDRFSGDDHVPTTLQPTSNRTLTTDRLPEDKSQVKNSQGSKQILKNPEFKQPSRKENDNISLALVNSLSQSIKYVETTQKQSLVQTMTSIQDFNQRLQNVLNQHAERKQCLHPQPFTAVKRLNNYLRAQLSVQIQSQKTKESEHMVTKSELQTVKADLKMQLAKIHDSYKQQIDGYVVEINKLKTTNINSSQITQLVQERENILNGLENALLQKGLELHTKEAELQESHSEAKRMQKLIDEGKNVVVMLKKEHQIQATKREEAHLQQITDALNELQIEHEAILEALEQKVQSIQEERRRESKAIQRANEDLQAKVLQLSRTNTQLTQEVNSYEYKGTLTSNIEEGYLNLKSQLQVDSSRIQQLEELCESQSDQLQEQNQLTEQLRGIILTLKTEHEQVKTALQTKITEYENVVSLQQAESQRTLSELQSEHDQVLQTASNAFQSEMSKVKGESQKLKGQLAQEHEALNQQLLDKKQDIKNLIQAVQQKEDELILRKHEHKQFVASCNKESQENTQQIESLQLIVQSLQQQVEQSGLTAQDKNLKIQSLQQQLNEQTAKSDKLVIKTDQQQEEVLGLQKDLAAAGTALQSERTENFGFKNEIRRLQEQLDNLSPLLDQSDTQKREQSEKIATLTKSLEEAVSKFNDTQVKLESQMENSLLSLDLQNKKIVVDLEERLRQSQEQLEGSKQTSNILRQNISDQSEAIFDLETQLSQKMSFITELETFFEQNKADLNVSQYELGLLASELEVLKTQNKELETKNTQSSEHFSGEILAKNEVICQIEEEKDSLRIKLLNIELLLSEKIQNYEEILDQLSVENEERVAEIHQQHKQVQDDLSKYLSNLEALTVVKQTAINEVEAGLKQTKTRMQEQAAQHQIKVAEMQSNMNKKVTELENTIRDLRANLSKRDAILQSQATVSELETRLLHSEDLQEQKQKFLEEAREQLSSFLNENKQLQELVKSFEAKNEITLKQNADLQTDVHTRDQAIERFGQELKQLKSQVSESVTTIKVLSEIRVKAKDVQAEFASFKSQTLKLLQGAMPDSQSSFSELFYMAKQFEDRSYTQSQELIEVKRRIEIQRQEILANHQAAQEQLQAQFDQEKKNIVSECEEQVKLAISECEQQVKLANQGLQNEENQVAETESSLLELAEEILELTEENKKLKSDSAQEQMSFRDQLIEQREQFNTENAEIGKSFGEVWQQMMVVFLNSSQPVNSQIDEVKLRIEALCMNVLEARQSITSQKQFFKQQQAKQIEITLQLEQSLQTLQIQIQHKSEELKLTRDQLIESEKQIENLEINNSELRRQAGEALSQSKNAHALELEDSLASQTSLVVENAQLLERLQRVESVLKETREKQESKSQDPNQETKLADFEEKLDKLKNQLSQAKQEVLTELNKKIQFEIENTKQAYIEDRILTHGLNQHSNVKVWNDVVKVVCRFQIEETTHLVVQTRTFQLFVVNKRDLHEAALNYLESFAADNTAQLNLEENNPEMLSLQELLTELCRDLAELHLEFARTNAENGGKQEDLSLVGMKDEVDYLTGENRDLRLKVKQLSINNAQMKIQIISLTEINLHAAIKDEDEGYIEAARNISDMVDEDPYVQEEQKEQTDFLSDQESFGFAMKVVSKLDTSTERRLEQAHSQIEQLKSQLKQMSDNSQHEDDTSTTIAHIRGTLYQFLKTTPITDRQNEELLKIIFSMMEFSASEVIELQNTRMLLKGNNKAVQQNIQNSGSRVNTSGVSSEGDKKIKKGILGLFSKAKTNQNNSATISSFAPQPVKR